MKGNLKSVAGVPYTGAIAQYAPDGTDDDHAIYRKKEEVIYQYGCFHSSFLKTGTAVIGAPQPLGSPCAQ